MNINTEYWAYFKWLKNIRQSFTLFATTYKHFISNKQFHKNLYLSIFLYDFQYLSKKLSFNSEENITFEIKWEILKII